MFGKIVKIFSNDLYGNPDDRKLVIFAAFEHKKYMNKYCIFAIEGEYANKKLYYGSIHIKDNTIVIFSVADNDKKWVDEFVTEYLSSKLNDKEYSLIDIANLDRAELISSTEVECDNLNTLDSISIKRVAPTTEETTKNSKSGLKFLLVLFILLGIGITYLYLNPDILTLKLKMLNCTKSEFNNNISMRYNIEKNIRFDKDEVPSTIEVIETYKFASGEEYTDFKDNNKESIYFKKDGEYKYIDSSNELKVFYNETTIIDNYKEMYNYLKKEGYTCQEETYDG